MAGGDEKDIWVIANWKSNKTISEALEWISIVGPRLSKKDNVKVVICVSFSLLSEVKKAITVGNFPLLVGSQDLSEFKSGPYTGEESAQQLKELVSFSIIGHSERRENLHETDQMVAEKVKRANEQGIVGMVCLQEESTPIPPGCSLVAFEPPSAISTSSPSAHADDPSHAVSAAKALKQINSQLRVIYGGSVTPDNAQAFLSEEELSGVLPGAASLDPEKFIKIVEIAQSI